MESSDYGLILAFDTDDPEFVRGWALGELWARMERDDDPEITALLRAESAEMVMRMCEARGGDRWRFRADDLGDGWLNVTVARI